MTACVVVPRRAVTAWPGASVLVIVIVIMLVAAANGWSLADATALVTALVTAVTVAGLPGQRLRGEAL